MKLSDQRIVCRFDDIGDVHCGTLTALPKWRPNPYSDTGARDWVFQLEDQGRRYELRARGQMVRAIQEAVAAAGADLEVGGWLAVELVGFGRSNRYGRRPKFYKARYEAPERCGCADSRLHGTHAAPTIFDAIDLEGEQQTE